MRLPRDGSGVWRQRNTRLGTLHVGHRAPLTFRNDAPRSILETRRDDRRLRFDRGGIEVWVKVETAPRKWGRGALRLCSESRRRLGHWLGLRRIGRSKAAGGLLR